MFGRAWRLLSVAVVALSLGACIISSHDVGTELKAEFPVKPGSYANKDGKISEVRRVGNEYRIVNAKTREASYARFYRTPEYAGYLFQFYDRKDKKVFYYFYATVTDDKIEFYDIDKLPTNLPEHIAKLLEEITADDRRYNTVHVKNAKRDTLYVIRELTRLNPNLMKLEKDAQERVQARVPAKN